ncbi:MAG: Gfo/Idh/MocA family protein [Rhodospirillales bacterium]
MAATRIAIVGAGLIGQRHLKVLLDDPAAYTVAAIADPAPASEAQAKAKNIPWFSDCDRMLDEAKPQGVIVATPNQLHVVAALACIARKIPVLVEKPLADSVRAAVELVDAGKRAGVPILTGHHRRHNPIMRKAAETIRGGGVGRLTAVVAMWLSRKPDDYYNAAWRRQPGGGTVLINGIHDIDCLRMMCGEIDSIQAFAANGARSFAVEDTAAAAVRFANGALGTVAISDAVSTPWSWEWGSRENPFYPHEGRDCYLVTGTKGSLAVPSLEHWWHEPGEGWGDPLTRRRIPVKPEDAYIGQMRNFAEVIGGKAEAVVSGEDGARTLAATLAITESAAQGRPIRVDDMLKSA